MKPLFKDQELRYKKINPKTGEVTYKGFKTKTHLKDELRMKEASNRLNNKILKRRKRNKIARLSRQQNR